MRPIILALLCLLTAPVNAHEDTNNKETRAVLVTGASTGIGRRITEHLAAKGYFVYAGARKKEDLEALDAIENVQPIRLDGDDLGRGALHNARQDET